MNSKVLCATQITLASESKIVSHGSTVSPKKDKVWLQNLLQRNNLRPFHIMHQRYDHIMNIILLNVWRRYEFTWRDDNYQMNIRTHLFIPNPVLWLGKTDYFSTTIISTSLAYLTNLRSRCPSSRNNLAMRALEPCWPLPCLAVRCILSACGELACWKGSPKLPASRQTTYPSTEG